MTRIEVSTGQDGMPVYTLKKSRLEKIKPIRTTAIALTTAAAIGLIVWQCQDGQAQTPNVNIIPTPTSIPNTPIPESTPTRTSPTTAPKPTPTIAPTSEPTRMPVPTMRPTSTHPPAPQPIEVPPNTPEPIPTVVPAVTPSTPTESQETCKEPGQNLFDIPIQLENPSGVVRLESVDVKYEFSNEQGSLKTERYTVITKIKIPKTPEEIEEEKKMNPGKIIDKDKSISEGTVFPVPVRGLRVTVTGEIPPGANPGSIKRATAEVRIRERNASREPIQRVVVAEDPCVKETLIAHFTSYNFNPQTKRTDATMEVKNLSGEEQLSLLDINTKDCSYDIAYIEAEGRLKNVKRKAEDPDLPLSLNKIVAIPAKTNTVLDVYFTPEVDKTGKIPTELSGCTVDVKREFNKQSPKPKLSSLSKLFTFFSKHAKVKSG